MRQRAQRGEEGLAIIVVALIFVAMLTMAALVLDGGQLYATRRQVQNAADSAAVAATRALDAARFRGGSPAAVDTSAQSLVSSNGGQTTGSLYRCTVTDKRAVPIAACSATDTVTGWRAPANIGRAVGVTVVAGRSNSTAFGAVVGRPSLTATAAATASIQPLRAGDSPFMVCANAAKGAQAPALLVPDATQSPPWRINSLAVGQTYDLHGPQVADCGAGSSSFKGGTLDGPFTLPAWIDGQNGVRAGPTRTLVASANGCANTDLDECVLLVPLCTDGTGNGNSVELYCVAWGSFLVHQNGANKHTGVFQSGAIAVGGATGSGDPNANSVRAIKLLA